MNPLGPAYDQDFEQHGGGNQRGAGLNSSSIHDIMTVDEYVEFTPNSNQRTSNGVDGGGASGGGGGTPVGGSNNDHMSRLIVGAARQAQDSHQQQMATAAASKPPDSVQRANNNRDHHANDIELERERNHGQTTSGFGAGLFGFHSTKEKVAYDGAPTIKLDWLDDGNNEYKLRDIHFHWGERRDNGSEHAIDGRRAAMEVSCGLPSLGWWCQRKCLADEANSGRPPLPLPLPAPHQKARGVVCKASITLTRADISFPSQTITN